MDDVSSNLNFNIRVQALFFFKYYHHAATTVHIFNETDTFIDNSILGFTSSLSEFGDNGIIM